MYTDTIDQPDLFAAQGDITKRPKVDQLVETMIEVLFGHGWVAGDVLAGWLQTNLRALREAANQSSGRILSGQQGYKLTLNASDEEVQRCVARLRSQASQMQLRANAILYAQNHGD